MAKKLALLVGNNAYSDPKLRRLEAPPLDVQSLAQVLREPGIGGFDLVDQLVNAPLDAVRRGIFRIFAERMRDDLVLLYFSGHGVLDAQGRLFLAVDDTRFEELPITALPASEIRERMNESRSRRQVLILDCCHSGAFYAGQRAASVDQAVTRETFEPEGYGREVLTATTATQYAFEGDEIRRAEVAMGTFTRFLVDGLRTGEAAPDRPLVTVQDLFQYAARRTRDADPRMTPQRWVDRASEPLVIARNPWPGATTRLLPTELLAALADPGDADMRAVAVVKLRRAALLGDERVRQAAREALERRLAAERDSGVHRLVEEALRELRGEEGTGSLPGVARREASGFAPRRRRAVPAAAGMLTLAAALASATFLAWQQRQQALDRQRSLDEAHRQVAALVARQEALEEALTAAQQVLEPAAGAPAKAQSSPVEAAVHLAPGSWFRDRRADGTACPECPDLAVVPSGTFVMGSPMAESDRQPDEGPQHRVRIERPFAAGRYEVTNGEWQACVAAGQCGAATSDRPGGGERLPVAGVSWLDAQAYVGWLGEVTGQPYRLPSEAEWEYLARAGDVAGTGLRFGWTSELPDDRAAFGATSPVAVDAPGFAPNPFGLSHLMGNVWEWVEDCWHADYRGAPGDGSAWTEAGGGDCRRRVLRGGAFDSARPVLRAANRYYDGQSSRAANVGLRVVRDLEG
jgi:formylglycine-generating enzyme required for sulfatase activity